MVKYTINDVLFLDIETAPVMVLFADLPIVLQECFKKKFAKELETADVQTVWTEKAALYPEFARIVCISVGRFIGDELNTHTFSDENLNEANLLRGFVDMINNRWNRSIKAIAAHSGKLFDYPWIIKKLCLHDIPIPTPFRIYGKKPWDIEHLIDTYEVWKMLGYESASLRTLAHLFGLEDPKSNMDGVLVAELIQEEPIPWQRITDYCVGDVTALAYIFKRLFKSLIEEKL